MLGIPLTHRIYFGVICLAALLVAVLGLFNPAGLASILPWTTVPPLHARFIGAIYAFGAVFLFCCTIARKQEAVRWGVLMTVIWTGVLGLISLFRLSSFDLGRLPDQIWFVSYTVYPLLGLFLLGQQSHWKKPVTPNSSVPVRIKKLLQIQGILVIELAFLLLVFPEFIATLWPWKATPLLAQVYSGPLMAYGVGSLLVANSLLAICTAVPAMLVFVAGTLGASILHRGLFSLAEIPDLLWFAFFVLMMFGLLATMAVIFRLKPAKEDWLEKVFV